MNHARTVELRLTESRGRLSPHDLFAGQSLAVVGQTIPLRDNIGGFGGEGKKMYVLELRFTKDGSALNVTDPHWIVIMSKPTDF